MVIFFTVTLKKTLKTDSEGVASSIRENVFKSYLELQDFGQQAKNAYLQDTGSSLEIQNSTEKSNVTYPAVDENEQESIVISKNGDELSPHSGFTSSNGHKSLRKMHQEKLKLLLAFILLLFDTKQNDEHVDKSI